MSTRAIGRLDTATELRQRMLPVCHLQVRKVCKDKLLLKLQDSDKLNPTVMTLILSIFVRNATNQL